MAATRISRLHPEVVDNKRANRFILQQILEIGDGLNEPVAQRDLRRPFEQIMSSGNIWATLARIILRARSVHDARAGSGELDHYRSQFENGKFFRVADIDRSGHVIGAIHQANEAIDQIVDVTKRSRLLTVAEHGDIATEQGLHDKV